MAPPKPTSAELGGSPIHSLADFLNEFKLAHLEETLTQSGQLTDLFAMLVEGRPAFLAALKAAGVSVLKDRQTFANALAKAGRGGRLMPPVDNCTHLQAVRLPPAPASALASQTAPVSATTSVDILEGNPEEMPARMKAALERMAVKDAHATPVATSGSLPTSADEAVVPATRGARMLAKRHWVVAGDLQNNGTARQVKARLEAAGRVVHSVNPFDRSGQQHKSLRAIGKPIDVIDLIINSYVGLKVVQEAADVGVKQVFIQPGAGSDEIEQYCAAHGLEVHHGCVLREL